MNVRISGRAVTVVAILLTLVAAGTFAATASARGNAGAPVAQTSTTGHTIVVNGHGEVDLAPNLATLQVGVESKGDDAASALASAATKLTSVLSAVEAQGVAQDHIQTTDLSLYFDSTNGTYVASHQISIRLDGTDKVGAVLDAAVQAGATDAWGVQFGLQDPSAGHDQALQAAITDARSRANSIASALGVTITGVGSASEATYNTTPIQYGTVAPGVAASAPTTPVQPGQLTVTADVTVTYTFG